MPEREKLSDLRIHCDRMFSELQSHLTVRWCKLPVLSLLCIPPHRESPDFFQMGCSKWTASCPKDSLTPRVNTSNSPHRLRRVPPPGIHSGWILQDSTGILSAAQKTLLSAHLLDSFLSFAVATSVSQRCQECKQETLGLLCSSWTS